MNVLANNQTMTGRFLRSLYVGRMTLYLWVSEERNDPCIFRDTSLSNGFMEGVSSDHFKLHHRWVTWILSYMLHLILEIRLKSSRDVVQSWPNTSKFKRLALLQVTICLFNEHLIYDIDIDLYKDKYASIDNFTSIWHYRCHHLLFTKWLVLVATWISQIALQRTTWNLVTNAGSRKVLKSNTSLSFISDQLGSLTDLCMTQEVIASVRRLLVAARSHNQGLDQTDALKSKIHTIRRRIIPQSPTGIEDDELDIRTFEEELWSMYGLTGEISSRWTSQRMSAKTAADATWVKVRDGQAGGTGGPRSYTPFTKDTFTCL